MAKYRAVMVFAAMVGLIGEAPILIRPRSKRFDISKRFDKVPEDIQLKRIEKAATKRARKRERNLYYA